MGASAPFWRFSAASYPDLEDAMPVQSFAGAADRIIPGETDISSGVCILLTTKYDAPIYLNFCWKCL